MIVRTLSSCGDNFSKGERHIVTSMRECPPSNNRSPHIHYQIRGSSKWFHYSYFEIEHSLGLFIKEDTLNKMQTKIDYLEVDLGMAANKLQELKDLECAIEESAVRQDHTFFLGSVPFQKLLDRAISRINSRIEEDARTRKEIENNKRAAMFGTV